MSFAIMRRCKTIISHDPQRRCYDGHLNKAEVVWTAWSELERWPDAQVAERRLEFWRGLNDYAVSQRGKGAAWELKLEAVMSTWPFPPPGGPVPWTPEQQRAYKKQQRDQIPDAPF